MKTTKQGVRNLNLIGPQRHTGARPPRPGEGGHDNDLFCHHVPEPMFADVGCQRFKVIGTRCSKCRLPLKGKAGDL